MGEEAKRVAMDANGMFNGVFFDDACFGVMCDEW